MSQYFIYSKLEDNYLSIPSKLLYNVWDQHKQVIIESNNGSRTVETLDYKGYECTDDYRIAKFKMLDKDHVLDPFRLKLLIDYQIHHEWFNSLQNIWTSDVFIVPLKKVAALRQQKPITPSKEDQFNFLKNKIEHTVIPQVITSDSGNIWDDFLSRCKQIQETWTSGKQ